VGQPAGVVSHPDEHQHRDPIAAAGARAALVGLVGLALGAATAYAQAWLPHEVGSLANSVGTWALLAFLLALLGTNPRMAAMLGFVTLIALLGGYVLGAAMRGDPSSSSLMAFWGLSALVAGPVLGLGAHWLRTDRGVWAAIGSGVMGGVLVGEGVYGLTTIADTTYPPYWWGEILVGVVLVGYVAARRLRRPRATVVAIVSALVVAVAFVGVVGLDLISILP
jgi:hypothetical protein